MAYLTVSPSLPGSHECFGCGRYRPLFFLYTELPLGLVQSILQGLMPCVCDLAIGAKVKKIARIVTRRCGDYQLDKRWKLARRLPVEYRVLRPAWVMMRREVHAPNDHELSCPGSELSLSDMSALSMNHDSSSHVTWRAGVTAAAHGAAPVRLVLPPAPVGCPRGRGSAARWSIPRRAWLALSRRG